MGFVGTAGLQTPHLNSLARSGVYFNNAFVVYPVCSPSKAATYAGLHHHANGVLNNTPNDNQVQAKWQQDLLALPPYRVA